MPPLIETEGGRGKAVLVLVETVDDYMPLLEQAGYRLICGQTLQRRADASTQRRC